MDDQVPLGSTLTYLIVVSNVGNAAAPDVIVTDTVRTGQIFAAPLPEGELMK